MASTSRRASSRFLRLHRAGRWLWLVVVSCACVFVLQAFIAGRDFDTSIMALLPEEEQSPVLQLAKDRLTALGESRIIFLIAHEDGEQSRQAARLFTEQLRRSDVFSEVQGEISSNQSGAMIEALWPYRYNYLSREAREQLESIPVTREHPVLQTALARLYSPLAATVAPNLVDDPLQLFYAWQLERLPKQGFSLENNWLTRRSDNQVFRMVSVSLQESPYNMPYQKAALGAIGRAKNVLPADAQLLQSGLLFHAAHGAQQAQREISTIGLGSLAGITLLLVYALRRTRPVLLAFLPLAAGLVFSFALCLLLFERLHLITLAFGAGLVGVAIDYSLHYLCADAEPRPDASHENDRRAGDISLSTLRKILPAISLGLLSSVLAYAAQAAAPFPGLRQMAVFSALGLVGAWLTVILWLPLWRRKATGPANDLGLLRFLDRLLGQWPTSRSWPVRIVFVLLALAGLWTLFSIDYDDDIRRLQTSPQALLDEDARVQRLLGGLSPGQYFVVSGNDLEQLLQREQELHPKLDDLVAAGAISDYQSLAQWLPPAESQARNRELLAAKVYGDEGLLSLLAAQLSHPALIDDARRQFDNNQGPITLANYQELELARLQSFLWLGEAESQVHGLITLSGISSSAALGDLAAMGNVDGRLRFVDNVAAISEALKFHRQQFQRWLIAAYAVVLVLLIWRYGRSAWRLLAAPAIASGLAICVLNLSGVSLNIFNLLALLLVLGIGLDASIFLRESQRSPYAWVAVTLSAATTLLAFGLLALSATPVLHQFGITVLLGITGVWLIAPCFVINVSR